MKIENAPLIEHLIALRSAFLKSCLALFVAFCFCFFFASDLFNFLLTPYAEATHIKNQKTLELIYTSPAEFFFTQMKVALYGGFFLSFPVWAYQLYSFVAPGLYKKERQTFLPYLIAAPCLFFVGAAFVFYLIMPLALAFFLGMEQSAHFANDVGADISMLAKVSEYLAFVMVLTIAFGLSFQLPVLLSLMGQVGLVRSQWLRAKRRWMILLAFLMAAFLTPPDILSQIALGLPLIVLYEISILLVAFLEPKEEQEALESKEEQEDLEPKEE